MDSIEDLNDYRTTIDGMEVTVKYEIVDTMHDGKEVTILVKDILR
jgi:hypothetical protein